MKVNAELLKELESTVKENREFKLMIDNVQSVIFSSEEVCFDWPRMDAYLSSITEASAAVNLAACLTKWAELKANDEI